MASLEWQVEVLLEHRIEAGPLLRIIVGIDNCFFDESVESANILAWRHASILHCLALSDAVSHTLRRVRPPFDLGAPLRQQAREYLIKTL